MLSLLSAIVLCVPAPSRSQDVAPATTWPGAQSDGSILLPNGWRLRPHGKQIELASDLPVRMSWHPGGRWLAVQHAGYREHEIAIVDGTSEAVVARIPLGTTWSGMCWSEDGSRLYASGGVDDRVRVFDFDAESGIAVASSAWTVGSGETLDLPAGMANDGKGGLFVVLQRSHRLVHLDRDGKEVALIVLPADSFPFECAVSHGGERVHVSLWGRGEVVSFVSATGELVASVPTGEHPSEMLVAHDGSRLFVSNANENTVSVIDPLENEVVETLSSALFPLAPPGSTPNSLALSPNDAILLVANADNNDCAVIDVSERGRSRGLGFIPLGHYPTSIRFAIDGARVFVANGKGSSGSHPNPTGPRPEPNTPPLDLSTYTGSMFTGTLSVFPFPDPAELAELSRRTYVCAPLAAAAGVRGDALRPESSPIPGAVGEPSPIQYCVYVIKENRTYDQVFGDDPRGNGDPSLCLFPEEVTPNHHAIAREFVLLDNFYVESEVSADGHEWTMGAYASDFVERTWPVVYGQKGEIEVEDGRPLELGYPAEGGFALARPKNGYLWDLAKAAGISYRSYGEFVENGPTLGDPGRARSPALEGHFDPWFRSYDLAYEDVARTKRFLEELAGFEERGDFPRLVVLRLPNDHTSGTKANARTPRAYVADNDLALGMLLEGLSKCSFWPRMAVFVVEDDAQNGPDHVDAHRTVALVAGPFVRRGAVVSEMYSTCSMLRTMELILGLAPMSQFDAAARPMYACFTAEADARPYTARPARWPLDERNAKTSWGAELSETFDLAREDAADDLLLNEVIWRSIRGADSPMPRPVRAAFVRVLDEDDEDEEAREDPAESGADR